MGGREQLQYQAQLSLSTDTQRRRLLHASDTVSPAAAPLILSRKAFSRALLIQRDILIFFYLFTNIYIFFLYFFFLTDSEAEGNKKGVSGAPMFSLHEGSGLLLLLLAAGLQVMSFSSGVINRTLLVAFVPLLPSLPSASIMLLLGQICSQFQCGKKPNISNKFAIIWLLAAVTPALLIVR